MINHCSLPSQNGNADFIPFPVVRAYSTVDRKLRRFTSMISRLLLISMLFGWMPSVWATCTSTQLGACRADCGPIADVGKTNYEKCMNVCTRTCGGTPTPSPRPAPTTTATVVQPLTSAVFINIYWDGSWDADNPGLSHGTIDAATKAVIESSYLSALSEYGVKSVTFGGGLLPNKACAQKAPNAVGFYDPVNTSIAGFIQCEHDSEPTLQNSLVVYNIILPQSSLESDAWTNQFCSGPGSPGAWHYHGLQKVSIIPPNLVPFNDGPIYTIVMTNPKCFLGAGAGAVFDSLFHEMVEALTDPFPIDISIIPPHARVTFTGEIADIGICENAGPQLAFTDVNMKTPNHQPVAVATYWSNAQQRCVSFTDITQPVISNVAVSNWGSQTVFGISGSGFGSMPSQISLPNSALPYVEVKNNTQTWEAGNTINGDPIPLFIPSWFGTQVNNIGFGGNANNVPGAALTVWLCNPNSLKCDSHGTTSAPGPYNPRLQVRNFVNGEFATSDTITISLGSQQIMKNTVHGRCVPTCAFFSSVETLPPGSYSFNQTVSGSTPISRVSNGCQQVVLVSGEETFCTISDTGPPIGGRLCPSGYKSCGDTCVKLPALCQ